MMTEKNARSEKVYSKNPEEQKLFSDAVKATRTVLKNAVSHEGTTAQWRIYFDACRNCDIHEHSQDVQDCISVALLALVEAGDSPDSFRAALRAINNYLYSLRSINLSKRAQKTVYLEDLENEGSYIDVNSEIEKLVAEIGVQESLTPIQRKVFVLWVEGYSVVETADRLRLSVRNELVNGRLVRTSKAVEAHRAHIKKIIEKLYSEN